MLSNYEDLIRLYKTTEFEITNLKSSYSENKISLKKEEYQERLKVLEDEYQLAKQRMDQYYLDHKQDIANDFIFRYAKVNLNLVDTTTALQLISEVRKNAEYYKNQKIWDLNIYNHVIQALSYLESIYLEKSKNLSTSKDSDSLASKVVTAKNVLLRFIAYFIPISIVSWSLLYLVMQGVLELLAIVATIVPFFSIFLSKWGFYFLELLISLLFQYFSYQIVFYFVFRRRILPRQEIGNIRSKLISFLVVLYIGAVGLSLSFHFSFLVQLVAFFLSVCWIFPKCYDSYIAKMHKGRIIEKL